MLCSSYASSMSRLQVSAGSGSMCRASLSPFIKAAWNPGCTRCFSSNWCMFSRYFTLISCLLLHCMMWTASSSALHERQCLTSCSSSLFRCRAVAAQSFDSLMPFKNWIHENFRSTFVYASQSTVSGVPWVKPSYLFIMYALRSGVSAASQVRLVLASLCVFAPLDCVGLPPALRSVASLKRLRERPS
jgi:hypothetical protein